MATLFGKAGNYYYEICRGIDNREVQPSRERKSVGAENTFSHDLFYTEELENAMLQIIDKVWSRAERSRVKAKTLTLKFKYADFEQHTRSKTISGYFDSKSMLVLESKKLMTIDGGFVKGIRLLGFTLSNFINESDEKKPVQLIINF